MSEPKFTKKQLLSSKTLGFSTDVIEAVLEENKTYTRGQAKRLLSEFLKRKV